MAPETFEDADTQLSPTEELAFERGKHEGAEQVKADRAYGCSFYRVSVENYCNVLRDGLVGLSSSEGAAYFAGILEGSAKEIELWREELPVTEDDSST